MCPNDSEQVIILLQIELKSEILIKFIWELKSNMVPIVLCGAPLLFSHLNWFSANLINKLSLEKLIIFYATVRLAFDTNPL